MRLHTRNHQRDYEQKCHRWSLASTEKTIEFGPDRQMSRAFESGIAIIRAPDVRYELLLGTFENT
jgi:hypothetical protein